MTTAVLQVQGLRFGYPGQPAVFDGWSAALGEGVCLVYGDMGSGKTTLLRLLAGAVAPQAGQLVLGGRSLAGDAAGYRRQAFLADVGDPSFDQASVRACTETLCAADAGFDPAQWEALAQGLGLAPHLDKSLYMLSTGSRRKVALAAALAAGRPLTLLDEPAAALDLGAQRFLWQAVAALGQQAGHAVLVASSDPQAVVRCDQRIVLSSSA